MLVLIRVSHEHHSPGNPLLYHAVTYLIEDPLKHGVDIVLTLLTDRHNCIDELKHCLLFLDLDPLGFRIDDLIDDSPDELLVFIDHGLLLDFHVHSDALLRELVLSKLEHLLLGLVDPLVLHLLFHLGSFVLLDNALVAEVATSLDLEL